MFLLKLVLRRWSGTAFWCRNPGITEKLKQTRAVARSWLTRETAALTHVVKLREVTTEHVMLRMEEFEKRLHAVDEVQTKIEESFESEQEVSEDIRKARIISNKALDIGIEAVRVLTQL